VLRHQGTRTKSARWYQVWAKERPCIAFWGVLEMILWYIGVHSGWADSPPDTILPDPEVSDVTVAAVGAPSVVPVSAASGGPQAGAERVSVAQSGPDGGSSKELWNKCENYLHVA
jgi:hypothetical protein